MKKEIWKDIPEYEGEYQVSNFGNILSLKNNRSKILKPTYDKYGYSMYGLSKNGIVKNFRGHILVAIVFLNHKPCGFKLVIDHINGNPKDNTLNNLRIISHRENVSRGYKNKSSNYRGVCWHKNKNKYMAYSINRKYIGYYNTELEAYNAILEYEKKM
jgi:hypothetical protein